MVASRRRAELLSKLKQLVRNMEFWTAELLRSAAELSKAEGSRWKNAAFRWGALTATVLADTLLRPR